MTSQTAIVESRVCCITGGARGIGRELVKSFIGSGFRVVFSYINKSSKTLAEELCVSDRAVSVRADSSRQEGAETLLALALSSFGRADILINNAGVSQYSLLQDMTDKECVDIINANLLGAVLSSKVFIPHFISKQCGKIINISSVWGLTGAAMESVYSAAKAGIIGLSRSLAKELAPHVTVNVIAPGAIKTDMLNRFTTDELADICAEIPLGRLGASKDVAAAALFLASRDADYITGQVLSVNGGMV